MVDWVACPAGKAAVSAARSACRLVTRSAAPSTSVTTSAVPRKIFVPSGSLTSVPPPLLWIGAAEFVEVRPELVAARVELKIQRVARLNRHGEIPAHLGGALVPGMQDVPARGYPVDREGSVARGLAVIGIVAHQHERTHLGMHVAENPDDPRPAELDRPGFPSAVESEVEGILLREREDVVVEWVVVGKGHSRAHRQHQHVRRELL